MYVHEHCPRERCRRRLAPLLHAHDRVVNHFRSPSITAWSICGISLLAGLLGACTSSTPSAEKTATTPPAPGVVAGAYCIRATAYQAATSKIDVSSAATAIAGFAKAAAAARAMAKAAPPEERVAHDRLASAAEELVAGIRKRAPRTVHDFDVAGKAVTASLQAKYGDLVRETGEVKSFARKTCGLSIG